MKFAILIGVALALSGVTIKAKRKVEPRIVAESVGRDCCDSRDGLLPPCISKNYTFENPVNSTVDLTLHCGSENQEVQLSLPAHTRQQVEICPESPGEINCFILTWSKKEP